MRRWARRVAGWGGGAAGPLARCVAPAVVLAAGACESSARFRDRFRDMTPREAYEAGLAEAGLAETALVRDWVAAGRRAVESAAAVAMPFQESGFVTAEAPGAAGYRVDLPRGRKLLVEIEMDAGSEARVFFDLFREADEPDNPLRPVFSSDSTPLAYVHQPWRGGTYLLRLQPELLRGGSYRVTIRQEAQFGFPVEGRGMRAIGSVFGAPRDGGRRLHRGVDIFAPRGTPVLSATPGRVSRVETTELGGKVVWVRDTLRHASVYYAHLDSQTVQRNQEVRTGDTLGLVGNTGNARTTPPHLHFGIYRRGEGAVDPAPFLRPPGGRLPVQAADAGLLGARARVTAGTAELRVAPERAAGVLLQLSAGAAVRVVGAAGAWYRVLLDGGAAGYVSAGSVGTAGGASGGGDSGP